MNIIPRLIMRRFVVTFYGRDQKPVFCTVIEALTSDFAFITAEKHLPAGMKYDKITATDITFQGAEAI